MNLNVPVDIRAEIISNYFDRSDKAIAFLGNHKRNAYEDIESITQDHDGIKIDLSRQGLYDILPEALFHPIDRFDNIPANEYKERFAEEVELQHIEESNARSFFSAYDRIIFDLSSVVSRIKCEEYSDVSVLSDIICDTLPQEYRSNRFVARTIEFTTRCHSIRGDVTLITLMLRKVMSDEGLKLVKSDKAITFADANPRYDCQLQEEGDSHADLYLGNVYDENVLCYDILYWSNDCCDEAFLKFVDEIKAFEDFVNDFFMGIETTLRFNISDHALPVRLSDELSYNYLNYNTNL